MDFIPYTPTISIIDLVYIPNTKTIAKNGKTGLYVSKDGSQLSKDGSGKRKGRSPRFIRLPLMCSKSSLKHRERFSPFYPFTFLPFKRATTKILNNRLAHRDIFPKFAHGGACCPCGPGHQRKHRPHGGRHLW